MIARDVGIPTLVITAAVNIFRSPVSVKLVLFVLKTKFGRRKINVKLDYNILLNAGWFGVRVINMCGNRNDRSTRALAKYITL